jgi:hypothetical protein
MHLLARFSRAYDALFGLLENGALMIAFRIDGHISVLRKLHDRCRSSTHVLYRDDVGALAGSERHRSPSNAHRSMVPFRAPGRW